MIECWLDYKCCRNLAERKILRLKQGRLSGGWEKWPNRYLEIEGEEPNRVINISRAPSLSHIMKVIKARNGTGRDSA